MVAPGSDPEQSLIYRSIDLAVLHCFYKLPHGMLLISHFIG